jgi:hypothetical protein
MIYVFGNSHAHFFTDSNPGKIGWGEKNNEYFKSYSGNFHNPKYNHVLIHKFEERFFPHFIPKINELNMTENDFILFAVGEIDCRWHFTKKVKTQNKTIEEVLNEEIEHFFPTFLKLKENGYNIVGWGGHPSTTRGHHDPDPDDPIYGDCLFRNEISLKLNDLLKEKCDKNDIKFLSIIRHLIKDDKMTDMSYYYDDFHLNPKAMKFVIDESKKLNIL